MCSRQKSYMQLVLWSNTPQTMTVNSFFTKCTLYRICISIATVLKTFRILDYVYVVNVSSLNLSLEPKSAAVLTKQLRPNWWVGLTDPHVLFDLCEAYSTCLTCYSQRVSQSEPDTQVFPESEAAWRVVDEQREQKRKKKDGWFGSEDGREHDGRYII